MRHKYQPQYDWRCFTHGMEFDMPRLTISVFLAFVATGRVVRGEGQTLADAEHHAWQLYQEVNR